MEPGDDREDDDTMIYTGTGLGHHRGVDRDGTVDGGWGDRVEDGPPAAPDEPAEGGSPAPEEPDDR